MEVSEKKVNHWFVKLESRPGMKTESVDKFNGSSMRSEISAILITYLFGDKQQISKGVKIMNQYDIDID